MKLQNEVFYIIFQNMVVKNLYKNKIINNKNMIDDAIKYLNCSTKLISFDIHSKNLAIDTTIKCHIDQQVSILAVTLLC